MTLDECYAKYEGTVVLVDGNPADAGQCVQWADTVLVSVYGDATHYGNAIDWWNDPGDLLTDGFEKITDGSVKKGDFVIFNQKVGSIYGHIDVAMQDGTTSNFLGSDSNWGGNMTVHEVQHSNADFVIGSLRERISMGVTIQGSPSAIWTGTTRLDVFARGSDNNLWQKTWTGKWGAWVQVATSIFSDPSVTSTGPNRYDVLAVGDNGNLTQWTWDGKWEAPVNLGQPE